MNLNRKRIAAMLAGTAVYAAVPPPGFAWPFDQYPLSVVVQGGTAVTDFIPERHINPACYLGARYFVDVAKGNDTNAGTSLAAPVKSIWKAFSLGNATGAAYRVTIVAGVYPRANGWTNNGSAIPNQHVVVDTLGGTVITGPFDALAWGSADATYTNSYKVSRAGVCRVFDLTTTDAFGQYVELVNVADAATCNTTPGSWAQVGSDLYVRRADGAAVTNANTRAYLTVDNLILNGTSGDLFVRNVVFEGGPTGAARIFGTVANVTPRKAIFVNCRALYSGQASGVANGMRVYDYKGLVAFVGCSGMANSQDGFNAHYNLADSGSLYLLTVNCEGVDNGRYNSQSNQGLTIHESVVAIDINGHYAWNHGGNIRNINQSQMWVICPRCHDDVGDVAMGGTVTPTDIFADDQARIWVDGGTSGGSATSLRASGTSVLLYRNHTTHGGGNICGTNAQLGAY